VILLFDITASVSSNDGFKAIEAALKELESTQVLVGIPEDESMRQDGQISNAALMYIHTNGSPMQGIPARPVIEPALEDSKEQHGKLMGEAVKAAMNGNVTLMHEYLEKAGLAGQSAAKNWFTNPNNGFAPLNPETAKRKEKKGATIERPLIDTGALMNAITYVMRKKQ